MDKLPLTSQEYVDIKNSANPINLRRAIVAQKFVNGVAPAVNKKGGEFVNPVTDLRYRMDGYLQNNLDEVPKFLRKAWDCVIIVSGNGKVGTGKSTIAMQVAYYLAWKLNEIKKKKGEIPIDTPVSFTNENLAFDPDELMKIAERLPRNSVIVYDEGRAGLDSARAMENINKGMQDFFQECRQYGHVIIIVLPDFFKLTETIAVPRSLFLINVYTDKHYNRGFFSFYSEHRKELLYVIGKKKWGTSSKYMSVSENFYGKFTDFFPIDKDIYDEKKKAALKKKRKLMKEQKTLLERNLAWWILYDKYACSSKDIASLMTSFPGMKFSVMTIRNNLTRLKKWLYKEGYEGVEDIKDIEEE